MRHTSGKDVMGDGMRAAVAVVLASVTCATVFADRDGVGGALAIDVTKPVRVRWPLDIGPDISADRADARVCLRARQGANELQTPDGGRALYGFRLEADAEYRTCFRVRWTTDGVGSIECNNSWFVGFDDRSLHVIESNPGYDDHDNAWHWERGPNVKLSRGVHWLRVELREDGPLMDRAVLVPVDEPARPADLDTVKPLVWTDLAGELPPLDPQHPIQALECFAAATRSLVIGADHVNEITVGVSRQDADRADFRGTIDVRCPTVPDLKVVGDTKIVCRPGSPLATHVLTLRFPDRAARRSHEVTVSIRDGSGRTVFREDVRFVKAFAWAFLGPFGKPRDAGTDDTPGVPPEMPCDRTPLRLAQLSGPAELGLAGEADPPVQWRIVADGSCCDWTGAVDLVKVFGRKGRTFAYAVTWIQAEKQLRHRSFNFQADDAGWLWVNGRFLAVLPVSVPKEANRLWSSALLEKGRNPVVVKLTQDRGYWGFRFDVIDWHWQGRRGDVITGLEVADWPGPR